MGSQDRIQQGPGWPPGQPCPEAEMKTLLGETLRPAREGGQGCSGGQKLGQVQIRKAKQQNTVECALASELKSMKFRMQWIRSGSSDSKSAKCWHRQYICFFP